MRLGVLAILVVAALFEWIYGTYCAIRMFWHRKPGLPHYSTVPTDEQLTPIGRKYMRRWLWSWAIGVLLSVAGSAL